MTYWNLFWFNDNVFIINSVKFWRKVKHFVHKQSINYKATKKVKRIIGKRGEDDQRLLALSFERCLNSLIEKGFTKTLIFPEENDGTLLLRYEGPFIIDIERDERLDVSFCCYSPHYDKPLSMKKVGLSGLVFMFSNCEEHILYLFHDFWDPWDYVKCAELVCIKFFDYYDKIEWVMKEENQDMLYKRLKEIGMEFMQRVGTRPDTNN